MDITSETHREEVRREYIFQFCGVREMALMLTERDSVVQQADGSLLLTFKEPAGTFTVNLNSPGLAWVAAREFTIKVPITDAPTRQPDTINWPNPPLLTL